MLDRNRTAGYIASNGKSEETGHVFWGGVKEFADGSLGARTALFFEPYTQEPDQPVTSGVRNIPLEELKDLAARADSADLQIAIHAIGDLAVEEVCTIALIP